MPSAIFRRGDSVGSEHLELLGRLIQKLVRGGIEARYTFRIEDNSNIGATWDPAVEHAACDEPEIHWDRHVAILGNGPHTTSGWMHLATLSLNDIHGPQIPITIEIDPGIPFMAGKVIELAYQAYESERSADGSR